ncbi:hypothetical protein [Rhodopirellula sallentina]|uniref:Leucine Rich repeats (2 copies) n=1 Tax=Rhodopirellula sallentina SM41 TaxID=1263870 RepID=M5U3H9_9BACT|nr:hypothetical protein [Rhodopirellula sallentina]EMI55814.1 hypothetical protein RSSM_02738 [Rhodopirellula sallentina SM41]
MRALLTTVAASATGFWLVRRRWMESQRQAEIVRRVEELGGVVGYAHEWDNDADRGTGLPTPGPAILRRILGEHFFFTPNIILFDESTVCTNELPAIDELSTLTQVAFTNCVNLDDRIIDVLVQLPDLRVVTLYGTPITYDALFRLKSLPRLEMLHVPHTRLDGKSAAQLSVLFGADTVSWNDDPLITNADIFTRMPDGGEPSAATEAAN